MHRTSSFQRALLRVAALLGESALLARERLVGRHADGERVAEIHALHEECRRLREENLLLRTRLQRVSGSRRPHYRSWERFRVLWHKARYGLSVRATARAFVLLPATVCRWIEDSHRRRSRLSRPPCSIRNLGELIEAIIHQLRSEQIHWGTRRIAHMLAHLGLKSSRSSVQRILKRRLPRRPRSRRQTARGPLRAKHPNHLWLIDFTKIGWLGFSLHVGAAIDLYSRKVVALLIWKNVPSAKDATNLIRRAIRHHGKPTHLVSDHGSQFTAKRFVHFLKRQKIRHRYGAVASSLSVSVIERFWRTFKQERGRVPWIFLPTRSVQRRAHSYVIWYNRYRPHGGLKGATPEQVFYGKAILQTKAAGILQREFLNSDPDLPIYRLVNAA